MKKILTLFSILLISTFLIATVHAEEGRKICSSKLKESTIDGDRMPNAVGNLEGTYKLNKKTGSLTINAEGISNSNEKITLNNDMKIRSIIKYEEDYFFKGHAPILTISKDNNKTQLKNVTLLTYWSPATKTIYILYNHPYLEETFLTFRENC